MTETAPTEPISVPAPVAAALTAPANKKALPETTEAMPWPSNHDIKKESNPFTDRDWRMLSYAWLGLFVRIILVVGALFSVYQYLAAREEKRVERTLSIVELWENKDYQTAQQALKARLTALNAKYASLLGANASPAERAVYFERIGIEALTADGGTMPLPEFQEQFDKIVYFLNRLSFCVEGGLCSKDMTDAYFRDYAVSFWSYFKSYVVRQRRSGTPTYALPIERYVSGPAQPAAAQ